MGKKVMAWLLAALVLFTSMPVEAAFEPGYSDPDFNTQVQSALTEFGEKNIDLEAGELALIPFKAPYNGSINFYSDSSYDSVGIIYDINGNQLALDDDGNGMYGNNFNLYYLMTEGRDYYLGIRMRDVNTSGSVHYYVYYSHMGCMGDSMMSVSDHYYVCPECSYTSYMDHQYSMFVSIDEKTHKAICDYCGETDAEHITPHNVQREIFLDRMTHSEYCPDCGMYVEHEIAAKDNGNGYHTFFCIEDGCDYSVEGEHDKTYGTNNADGTHTIFCSTCGVEYTENHSLYYSWEGSHAHSIHCNFCDYYDLGEHKASSATSIYDSGNDYSHYYYCDVCGNYVYEEHTYTYTSLGASHRKQCTKCSYTTIERHNLYTSDYDDEIHVLSCSDCTYTKEEKHDMVWTPSEKDSAVHVGRCKKCDWEDVRDHSYSVRSISDSQHQYVCDDCGHTEEESHKKQITKNADTHTVSCLTCEYSLTAEHEADEKQFNKLDDSMHTSICKVCRITMKIPHSFGEYTCEGEENHTRTCKDCGYVKTEEHDYRLKVSPETHIFYCINCLYETSDVHNVFVTSVDSKTHDIHCDKCDKVILTREHDIQTTYDDETHTSRCTWCDYEEQQEHIFEIRSIGEEKHLKECTVCDLEYELDHEFVITDNGDLTLTVTCKDCDYLETRSHALVYTDLEDGTHKVTCDDCDYEAIEEHEIAFSDYGSDISHKKYCERCSYKEKEDHTYVDHKCVCGNLDYLVAGQMNGLTYYLYKTGVLTIDGEGALLNNFAGGEMPWADYANFVKQVELGEGITTIGKKSLTNLVQVKQIMIPASVTEIKASAFDGCAQLEQFAVSADNAVYTADMNGVIYSKDTTELVRVPNAWKGDFFIDKNVKVIKESAFSTCHSFTGLTYATITNLTNIEDRAFQGCRSLQSITFPRSLMNLGDYMFYANVADNKELVRAINENYGVNTEAIKWTKLGYKVGEAVPDVEYEEGFVPEDKELVPWLVYSMQQDSLQSVKFESNEKNPVIAENAFAGTRNVINAYYLLDNPEWDPDLHVNYGGNLVWRGFTYAELITSGVDGDVAWKIYNNGVLHLWGTGYHGSGRIRYDSGSSEAPWKSYNALISRIVIDYGITYIGDNAFRDINQNLISVTIPNTVTSIGYYAFRYCSKLETVHIGKKSELHSLNHQAFYGCASLKTFHFPHNLSYLDSEVFYDCSGLKKVEMDCEITELHAGMFGGCSSLEEIILPKNLHSISNSAFSGCSSLKTIHIPASVTTISDLTDGSFSPFYNCSSLESITVDKNNTMYQSKEGMLYDKAGTALYVCPAAKSGTVKIPAGTTAISAYAFQKCTDITELILPDSLAVINDYAFSGCAKLASVQFGRDSKLVSIGKYAFRGCESMKNLILPNKLFSIGEHAFNSNNDYYWDGYESIYFYDSFDSISIPDTVSEIGTEAFASSTNVIYRGTACQWEKIGYVHPNVTANSGHVWGEGEVIPSETVGKVTYRVTCEGCGLASYELSFITDNGKAAVTSYRGPQSGIAELIVPEEIAGCKVTMIGSHSFERAAIQKIVLPDTVEEIGEYAFYDCDSLINIEIPAKVNTIATYAFANSEALKEIVIPGTVKVIGRYAFEDCSSLEQVILEQGVESISYRAFKSCSKIKRLVLPQSLNNIGSDAFYESRIDTVELADLAAWCSTSFGDYNANPLRMASRLVVNGEEVADLVIPESVTAISNYAFYGTAFLRTITIPDNVNTIGNYAFAYNENVTNVLIENGVKSIKSFAFVHNSNMKSITIPVSITSVEDGAFQECKSLEKVIWESDCRVAYYCFYNCEKLSSVILAGKMDYIGSQAFYGCPALKEIELPSNITGTNGVPFAHYYSKLHGAEKIVEGFTVVGEPGTFAERFANENDFLFRETYHEWDEGEVITEPTCDMMGQKLYHCTLCEKTKYEYVDSLGGHDWDEGEVLKEASCYEDGMIRHTCSRCGEQYDEYIYPKEHTWGDPVREGEQPATCINEGWYYNTYYCTECGTLLSQDYIRLAPLGHDYVSVTHDASCTEPGWIVYHCKRGDHNYWDYYQAASGHTYTDTVYAPDCAGQGYTEHTCTTCGYSYRDSYTDALEHAYVESVIVPATCTADGIMKYTCECGDFYTGKIIAKGHAFDDGIVILPTCNSLGYTVYTCEDCGFEFMNQYVKADETVDHEWDEGVIVKEASCEDYGTIRYTCKNCNDQYNEKINPAGHTYEETVYIADCTEQGYTEHTCVECGYSYCDSYTEALGHTYTSSVIAPATCTADGLMKYTCECKDSYTAVIPSSGHAFDEGVVVAPTCGSQGYTIYTCDECGFEYRNRFTKADETIKHVWGEGEVITAATCEKYGTTRYTCENCGKQYDKEIVPTGHTYTEKVFTPNCNEQGYTKHTCDDCGYSYRDTYTAETGHAYVGLVVRPATCTVDGQVKYTCECKDSYTTVIPAFGHTFGEGVVVAPTCTSMGYTEYTCGECGFVYRNAYTRELGHSYRTTVIERATCERNGLVKYTCDCNASYTTMVPAVGHTFGEGVVVEPTCGSMGYTRYSCTTCKYTYANNYVHATEMHTARAAVYEKCLDETSGSNVIDMVVYCMECDAEMYRETLTQLASPVISSLTNKATGVEVKWGAVGGAEKYRVFYRVGTGGWTTAADVTGTSTVVTGLANGNTYSFLIRCLSEDGKTYTSAYDVSKSKSITYSNNLAAPVISSLNSSAAGVQVNWGAVSGAEKYRVFYRVGTGSWTTAADVTGTSYVVTGLANGNTYSFLVRCVSADGKTYTSAYDVSKSKSITYSNNLAAPVISSLNSSAAGVQVSWGAVSGAEKYRVFYRVGTGSWTTAADVTGTSYVVTGLTNGNNYSFLVRCVSADGKTYTSAYDVSKSKSITYSINVAAPVISSLNSSANGVQVSWGAVSGAAKYRVFYRVGTGSWATAADVTGTSYVVTGLTNGSNYSFLVRCLSADGNSYISPYDVSKSKSILYTAK